MPPCPKSQGPLKSFGQGHAHGSGRHGGAVFALYSGTVTEHHRVLEPEDHGGVFSWPLPFLAVRASEWPPRHVAGEQQENGWEPRAAHTGRAFLRSGFAPGSSFSLLSILCHFFLFLSSLRLTLCFLLNKQEILTPAGRRAPSLMYVFFPSRNCRERTAPRKRPLLTPSLRSPAPLRSPPRHHSRGNGDVPDGPGVAFGQIC